MNKFSLSILAIVSIFSTQAIARDLTYRLGIGYSQATYYYIADQGGGESLSQAQGLDVSYGIAKDTQVGGFFGFTNNFDITLVGATVRYDIQGLINRDSMTWNYLNIFLKGGVYAKLGTEQAKGITIHMPAFGFEILPFERNNFAVGTTFGLIWDFKKKNKINLTQAQFGDLSIKYYF